MMLVHQVRKLAMPLHQRVRRRKLDLFFQNLRPASSDSLLDVGGSAGMDGEFGKLYSFFENVTTLNIEPVAARGVRRFVLGDARHMPFADQSYDWVFSNAVIEHVGDWREQQKMASEIRRVARKGYFVTTPNRAFPVDPHSYLPFYHYLSCELRERLVSAALCHYVEFEPYWMLSRKALTRLFPDSMLTSVGARTCLIAWNRLSGNAGAAQ
jgi:hypothetical protein